MVLKMYRIPKNLQDVVRVEIIEGRSIQVIVTKISWCGQHPESEDVIFSEMDSQSTEKQIVLKIKELLKCKDYIKKCTHCNKYFVNGWMHNDIYCQGCASKYFDVAY